MTKKGTLPLLAMPGLLILSYGLDVATATVKAFASSTFRAILAAWGHVFVEFVFAGAVILLAWLVLTKRENKLLVGWLFLVVGLITFFISTPFRYYLSYIWGATPAPHRGWFYYFLSSFGFYGFMTKASALIVVLGLVNLIRKPR
jgi:hypothetical protein